MQALTMGIAGGSGSGKTTIARKIIETVGDSRISFLEMDNYYNDLSHLPIEERAKNNFDHPASIDIELFIQHIKELKSGNDIKKPQYDFVTHTRRKETQTVKAHPVVFLEGILLYENSKVLDLIDIKTFVETPSDTRFIRRLMRDIKERGRTPESVVNQYYKTVRPMYKMFVAPTKECADIIIPWQDYNDVAVEMVISRIEGSLKKKVEEERS
jgi:uridine kinase